MHTDDFLQGLARGFVTLLKEQGFASYIYFMSDFKLTKANMERIHEFMNALAPEWTTIPAVILLFRGETEEQQRIAFYIVAVTPHELWVNWQKLIHARREAQSRDPNYTEFEQEFIDCNQHLKETLRAQGYEPVEFSDIPNAVQ